MSAPLNVAVLERLAEARFKVLDQRDAEVIPFRFNREQRRLLGRLASCKRVIVLKGRQQGISTVVCLWDLAYALTHPGHSVCICADSQENADGLLGKIRAWAKTIIPVDEVVVDNVKSLVLGNGSTIDARTSLSRAAEGESRTGRSRSYNLLHATELAFWQTDSSTFTALTSTMGLSGQVVIESTASPADNLYNTLWHKGPGWEHVFFSVEEHDAYQADPSSISEAAWASLQSEHGFTSRPHAAWWLDKLATDNAGDVHRTLREYPPTPDRAFSFAEGRWIHRWVDATPKPTSLGNAVTGVWTTYPGLEPEPVLYGVDTGGGHGGDHSAVAVIGRRTGRIHATWSGNRLEVPAFARLVIAAAKGETGTIAPGIASPYMVVVEDNGIGEGLAALLREANLPVMEHTSNEGEKHVRFSKLRQSLELGDLPVGDDVVEEIKSSVVKLVNGKSKFIGRDDLLNALSFARSRFELAPYVEAVGQKDPRTYVVPNRGSRTTF